MSETGSIRQTATAAARRKAKRAGRPFGTVRLLPSGRYQARYRQGLDRYSETFATEPKAHTWLTEQELAVKRGGWRAPSATVTLGEYARTWLARRHDLKATTTDLYTGLLDRHLLADPIAKTRLRELDSERVAKWNARVRKERVETVVAGTTVRDVRRGGETAAAQSYRLLRTILGDAVRDQLIETNPCTLRGAGSVKVRRPERLATVDQLRALTDALSERHRALLAVLAWGGLRIGEALALTRADVDVSAGTVRVRQRVKRLSSGGVDVDVPKSSAGLRIVVLPASVVDELRDHLDRFTGELPGHLVFPNRSGDYMLPETFAGVFAKAKQRAQVDPGLRVHDLRATALTLAAHSGATVRELQDRAGHATPDVAMLYQRVAQDRQQQIAANLDVLRSDGANVARLADRR
jgi:integrase